ncbi:MAG: hypothetical protein N2114_01855 [Candidatus Goldbacteria bacterium]|nr:hypothetical protein [Candidatus Goldiibacteriota bacterium]
MKKLLSFIFIIFLSCTPLNRTNPTDPNGQNYIGWHYIGEIGEFKNLVDFTIVGSTIYAVDSVEQSIKLYNIDGSSIFNIVNPGSGTPVFIYPTGITENNMILYIIDHQDGMELDTFDIPSLFTANPVVSSYNLQNNGDKITDLNNELYVAQMSPPQIDVYGLTGGTPVRSFSINIDICDTNCLLKISDIIANTATNEILIADSDLDRIAIYNTSGNWIRNINIGKDIKGIAIKGNRLYIPTKDGILRINYNTGQLIDIIANYGEGNGRITKPGIIRLYGNNYILVENTTSIKYFQIDSL